MAGLPAQLNSSLSQECAAEGKVPAVADAEWTQCDSQPLDHTELAQYQGG